MAAAGGLREPRGSAWMRLLDNLFQPGLKGGESGSWRRSTGGQSSAESDRTIPERRDYRGRDRRDRVRHAAVLRLSAHRRRLRPRQSDRRRAARQRADYQAADRRQPARPQGRHAVHRRSPAVPGDARLAGRQAAIDRPANTRPRRRDLRASSEQKRREADLAYARQYLHRIEPLLAKHYVTANDVSMRAASCVRPRPRSRIRARPSARRRASSASTAISTRGASRPRLTLPTPA